MSHKFQVEAILDGITPRKDGGVTLRFVTNAVSKDQKVMLMEYYQSFGWLLFAAKEFEEADLPKETAHREVGAKTPSQRLRASLFVLWKQRYSDTPFDPWYEQQLEKIIGSVQARIDG